MCIRTYFKRNINSLIKWMLYELLCAIAIVLWSFFMKSLYDVLVNEGLGNIWNLLLFGLIFVGIYFLSSYLSEYYEALFLKKCNVMLKEDLYYSLINKDINSFQESNTAIYISMMNNDVKTIEEKYFNLLPTIFATYMLTIIACITMVVYNPLLGTITLLINLAPIGISFLVGNNMSRIRKDYMNRLEIFNTNMKDIFSGFSVIKTFQAETHVGKKFHDITAETEERLLDLRKKEAFTNSLMATITYFTAVVQLVLSVYFIIIGRIDMGILLGIMQISNYVSNPIERLSQYMVQYKSVKSIRDKIETILSGNEDRQEQKQYIEDFTNIRFEKVSYQYISEKVVINNFSYTFEKGKKYAIVGRSGCGKSTLMRLLMAYFQDYDGNIMLGDYELRNIDKRSLYQQVCCIDQNIMLFDDNVKNNITMFQEYNDEQVEKVLDMVGLRQVVDFEKEGIYGMVQESGSNFSGGERQRIAIARALIRETPVIILDEATSNLDNETAVNIENFLLDIENVTTIVITHKLNPSLLKRYDEIVVMAEGTIAERGTFEELMTREGLFYNLYKYGI